MMGRDGSPTPQFKSINSLVLSLLYGPTLTSTYDYWKCHSFDYMDLCRHFIIPWSYPFVRLLSFIFVLVQTSVVPNSATPWTAARQASLSFTIFQFAQIHVPLSWWCHPTISSSVAPFSSCPQSFPASGSFSMNQLFAWGGQIIGVSASTSVFPMNTQDWTPLG